VASLDPPDGILTMTILDRIENDPAIVFTVSANPYPETPRPYWNGVRRLVFREKANAFRYAQRLDSAGVYSVLATEVRENDDIGD
jgi:hypothetical protein